MTCLLAACGNDSPSPALSTDTATAKAVSAGSANTAQATLPDTVAFRGETDGKPTALYILKNSRQAQVAITNYGARIVSFLVPDKNGVLKDVVLGYDSIGKYIHRPETYFGAVVGRYGNRIAKGKFRLDGKTYSLATNNGPNSLHGGRKGFNAVVWDARQVDDRTLELSYLSKDGEEGYPGNLRVKVTYTLYDSSNALSIRYEATTDKSTVLNLTNHAYFNLNGQGSGPIANHLVQISADQYTPVDSTLIPTGRIEAVAGTPLDFRQPVTIGSRINDDHIQLRYGKGYDHNFVLNPAGEGGRMAQKQAWVPSAVVQGDRSGIVLTVFTDQPGLQFYTGNFMNGSNPLKGGKTDEYRTAFCLETQHYPDSPNEPSFPSSRLDPGKVYKTQTVYTFSTKK